MDQQGKMDVYFVIFHIDFPFFLIKRVKPQEKNVC